METKEAPCPDGKSRKKKNLTGPQWVEIQTAYEFGENIRELARKYGISHATICQRAKREGWPPHGSKKREAVAEATGKITENLTDKIAAARTDAQIDLLSNITQAKANYQKLSQLFQAGLDYKYRQYAIDVKNAIEAKAELPRPPNIKDDAYVFESITRSLRMLAVEVEFPLLGVEIKPGDDENDGFKAMTAFLEKARLEYDEMPSFQQKVAEDKARDKAKAEAASAEDEA